MQDYIGAEMFDWPAPPALPDWKILGAVELHAHRRLRARTVVGALVVGVTWLGLLGLLP